MASPERVRRCFRLSIAAAAAFAALCGCQAVRLGPKPGPTLPAFCWTAALTPRSTPETPVLPGRALRHQRTRPDRGSLSSTASSRVASSGTVAAGYPIRLRAPGRPKPTALTIAVRS